MPSLKLVSINIERSNHLDLVVPFLEEQKADIICVQESMEYDIPALEAVAGPCFFAGTTLHPAEGRSGVFGLGIFSRLPIVRKEILFYHGSGVRNRVFDLTSAQTKHETESHALVFIEAQKGDETFSIATTHFTWTPNGQADDFQRLDIKNLLSTLDSLGELVLCGDFNAPRGGEIFEILAGKYKDNIPAQYKTSIDVALHRQGRDHARELSRIMVDGLFTTPGYVASDVELHSGVSDHMAITAIISKM